MGGVGLAERKRARIGEPNQAHRSIDSAITLSEDSLILERFERNVTKASTPIGVISSHYGTAAWQVGAMGEVKWIVSESKPLLCCPDDPPWFPEYSATKMSSVEVIIVEGLSSTNFGTT